MATYPKYPGWRTMTSAERYNAKMDRLFRRAMLLNEWHNMFGRAV